MGQAGGSGDAARRGAPGYDPELTPVEVRLAERHRDLERAEQRCERYGRRTGIPLAAAGAWVVPSLLVGNAAATRLLLLTVPLIWVAASWISVRVHPRREPDDRGVRWTPLLFWVLSALALVRLARAAWYLDAVPRGLALALAAAGLAAVLAAAHFLAGRSNDASEGAMAMVPTVEAVQDAFDGRLWGWLGVAFLAVGAFRHLRQLWAEWRVRALLERIGAAGGLSRAGPSRRGRR